MDEGATEAFDRLRAWLGERRPAETIGIDDFPLYAEDPLVPYHRRINDYLQEVSGLGHFWDVKPGDIPAGVGMLDLSREEKALALRAILVRILFWNERKKARTAPRGLSVTDVVEMVKMVQRRLGVPMSDAGTTKEEKQGNPMILRSLVNDLLRSQLPLTTSDLTILVRLLPGIEKPERCDDWGWRPISVEGVIRAVEFHASQAAPTAELRQQLERWWELFEKKDKLSSDERKLLTRLKVVLGQGEDTGIEPGEAWSNAALEDLKQMAAEQRAQWTKLLQHCQQAETSKPTKKWAKASEELVEALGRDEFKALIVRWFELVALPRPVHREPQQPQYQPDPDQLIADGNSVILKGLAWSCAGWPDGEVNRALSRLAEVCFKKVRNLGPRCPRIGNACLYSLSGTTSEDAAAELSRLNQTVKQPSAKKLIGKSLDKAAELSGQTREDLEESTVPTYGLDATGCLKQPFGNHTATFCISGPQAMELNWLKADGKPQKSVPAEVKENHADEFKRFKRTLQDIEKMLPAQRQRIERLLMSERAWTLDKWRERYLNHPLLSFLSRRLIWHFKHGDQTALGAWLDGKIVDVHDRPLDWLALETQVRLWHPIGFEIETVTAWRRWLETRQIVQPFKQAHREVYLLTDAELQTDNHSNRFAAHIIGQHQFAALTRQRGWKYAFMGGFDAQSVPTIELPAWGLAAEYWVEPTGELAETGVSRYLATDQVRFVRDGDLIPLRDVPAVVFTEVMRDVDLFVGVCSIGNDPAWQDRGDVAGGGTYWNNYSFGALSATAHTRKDVLERLLPKLRIVGQCELKEKFLVVRGTLRTYKIHLGSGNILMEPNDQYLCIVPDRGAAAKAGDTVFLPFEGDNTLAIILSKAFLLAEDGKIKDETILRQIRSK